MAPASCSRCGASPADRESGGGSPLCVACWVVAGDTQVAGESGGAASARYGSGRLGQGVEVGGYRILDELGRGGMAVVYRATQPGLEREVALKILRTSDTTPPQQIERFLREGQAAARLSHPNVVPVFDVGEDAGIFYLAMEFVRGETLEARVRGEGLKWRAAAELVRDVAAGLHYAHTQGVVHRDVKPANVIIGDSGAPRIADFGLARLDDAGGITAEGTAIGTPSYMAPEQAAGETTRVGPPTDVYALGAMLYECLTGAPPFTGNSVLEILRAVQLETPAPLRRHAPNVPRDLVVVVEKCLEKDPADRYGSAQALADDLGRVLAGDSVSVRPPSPVAMLGRQLRRRPAVAVAGLSIAAALGVAGWAVWYTSRPAPTGASAADQDSARRAEAQPHYDRAVQAFGDHERLRRDGDAKAAFQALETATDAIGVALSKDPAFAQAYLVRARIRRQHRHVSGALADYEAAINLEPDLIDAYYERVRLRFDREFATMVGLGGADPVDHAVLIEDLNRITAADGPSERRFIATAMVALLGGRYSQAEQFADRAVTESPKSADAHAVRGIARTAYGIVAVWTNRAVAGGQALQGGLSDFDTAVKLGADPHTIASWRSQVLAGLGRLDEALAEINQTLEFDNTNHLAILLRARLLMLDGQTTKAEESLDAAIALAGETADIRIARAMVRLVAGVTQSAKAPTDPLPPAAASQVEAALDDLNWVVAHAPSHHIARFYRGIGQFTRLPTQGTLVSVVGADFQAFVAECPAESDLAQAAQTWLRLLRGFGVGDAFADAAHLQRCAELIREGDSLLAGGDAAGALERYASSGLALDGYDPSRPVGELVAWRKEYYATLLQRMHRGTARALAHQGETSAAIEALQRAVQAGYRDLSQIERDRAFAKLLEHARFSAVTAPMRSHK